jgi:cytochrome o ubiquinol oxidase operon protein cyoD
LSGFILSLVLTITAYLFVERHVATNHAAFSHETLVWVIISLALVQLIVQLFFFLHLGQESKPYWNLTIFLFTLPVLIILVFGSLWIMNHLNYNMMPAEVNEYLLHEEGIAR